MVLNTACLLLILWFYISVFALHRYNPKKSHSDALKHRKRVGGCFQSNKIIFYMQFTHVFLPENTVCSKSCSAATHKYCIQEEDGPVCSCMINFKKKAEQCVAWVLRFYCVPVLQAKVGEKNISQGQLQPEQAAATWGAERCPRGIEGGVTGCGVTSFGVFTPWHWSFVCTHNTSEERQGDSRSPVSRWRA